MQVVTAKIRSGKYKAHHHGYTFIIESQGKNVWTLSNQNDVEIGRETSKSALVNMLASYDLHDIKELHQQEFCVYA